jgi:hypothetical protein
MWTARACGAASPPRSSRSTVCGRRTSGYHPVHCGPVDELIPFEVENARRVRERAARQSVVSPPRAFSAASHAERWLWK